jgi:hypothetical protein
LFQRRPWTFLPQMQFHCRFSRIPHTGTCVRLHSALLFWLQINCRVGSLVAK